MSHYFAADFVEPGSEDGEPCLWFAYDEDRNHVRPVIRKRDLGPMGAHWDELVARVIAGNPDAQVPEPIAESVRRAGEVAMAAPYKAARLELEFAEEMAAKRAELKREVAAAVEAKMDALGWKW